MTATDLRKGAHCVLVLHAHLVFVTKYRHRVLHRRHLGRLEVILRERCASHGVDLVEINGEAEHVHLLVNMPPSISISYLVHSLKGTSSRVMRKEFPDLARHYRRDRGLWSDSYFAGSVGGAPLSVLRQYIESQARPT